MGFRFTCSNKINLMFYCIFTFLRILVIGFIIFYVIPVQLYMYFYLDFELIVKNSKMYYDNKIFNQSNTLNMVICWFIWIINIFICCCTCSCSCIFAIIIKNNHNLRRVLGSDFGICDLFKVIK